MIRDRRQPHLRRHQAGQNLVEFALVLPVLLMICLGILDLGRSFYTYIALTNAAREAARYAALNGVTSSAKVTQEFTTSGNDVSGCVAGTLSFTTSPGAENMPYRVNVGCQFQLVTPLIGGLVGATVGTNQITISSTATFIVE